MKFIKSILLTLAVGFAATTAFAEGAKSLDEVFARLDTNHDGKISLEEWKAAPKAQKYPAQAEKAFKKTDTNGDGFVSLEEFKANPPKAAVEEVRKSKGE